MHGKVLQCGTNERLSRQRVLPYERMKASEKAYSPQRLFEAPQLFGQIYIPGPHLHGAALQRERVAAPAGFGERGCQPVQNEAILTLGQIRRGFKVADGAGFAALQANAATDIESTPV